MSLRGLAYSSFHLPMMVMLAFFFSPISPFYAGLHKSTYIIHQCITFLVIYSQAYTVPDGKTNNFNHQGRKKNRKAPDVATCNVNDGVCHGERPNRGQTQNFNCLFLSLFHSLSWACLVPWDVCETRFSANEQVNRILTKTPNRPITLLTASFVLL